MSSDVVASTPRRNFFSLLWGVILRPRQTFADIAEDNGRSWLLMALLGIVLVMLPAIISGPITSRQIRENFNNQDFGAAVPEGAEVPADFNPADVASSPIITTVFPAVGAAVVLVIGWLIWSGAFHLIGSMAGGRNSFFQMLKTVLWAWIPYGIRGLVQAVYITATQTLITNPGLSGFVNTGPPPENPFTAVPPSPGILALQAFLSQIDIYLFWNFALLTIGIMAIAKLPRRKAMGLIIVVWAIFTLVRVGGAAAAGSIATAFTG